MKISNEAKVGMLVTIVLVMLGVLTIRTGNFTLNKEGYTVTVLFENIDGVSNNVPVMVNGFEVGRVRGIDFVDKPEGVKMKLTLWIDSDVKIHEEAQAYIKNYGFMGEKYVGLTAGDAQKGYLKDGALITGTEPADIDRILLTGQNIASQIESITAEVDARFQKNRESIDRIISGLDKTTGELATLTKRLDASLEKNETHIDSIILNFERTSRNIEFLTQDLMNNPWKILHRSKEKKIKKD